MEEPWAEMLLGDCLDVMGEIEDGSVDMVVFALRCLHRLVNGIRCSHDR